jgi:exopolysaccharide biosynthesis polyprenyl glycosylphosphotransferase
MLAVFATGQLTQFNLIAIYPDRWLWTISLTAVWLLCVLAPRMLFTQLVENGVVARRIVVVGDEPGHSRIAALSRELPRRFTVAAELSNSNFDFDLAALAARVGAAEIVVAGDAITDCTRDALRKSKRSGASVIKYANFYERETGRVDLTNSTEDWSRICTLQKKGLLVGIFQRAFDICISLLAFAVAAPVMLLAAIAIKLEDGGPVLFRQERVGLGGRNFTLVKFRSMHVNAEGDGAPTWAEHNDPRITRAGYFIRKLRIDELPQFWNVIKGDMSFIGPRPERPYFVRQLAEVIPYYDFRHCVRPGLTGWAQVSFRYSASFEDARIKTAYDLYYVKHRGILLDLIILMRTVVVVLWPEGVR